MKKVIFILILVSVGARNIWAQEIMWAGDLRFRLGVNSYEKILKESLKHSSISYRYINKIIVCSKENSCLSVPKKGVVALVFDPLASYESIVDQLIEHSILKENHPLLIPEVKVISQNVHTSATGFFWGDDGYIITCAHMVANETSFQIKPLYKNLEFTADRYTAELIAKDDFSDIALLKLKTEEIDTFLQNYSHFPSVAIDEREWSYKYMASGQSVTLRGFPSYAGGKLIEMKGSVLDPMASQWGTRLIMIDAKVDKGMSGGTITSHEGYVVGVVFGQMMKQEITFETLGALATDFYSDYFLLKQLKVTQSIKEDLIIRPGSVGEAQISIKPRDFQYSVRWSTLQPFLTFEGVTYVNAFCGQKEKRKPCGVLVWQNQNSVFAFEPQKTIITKINGIDLASGEPEGSLKKFSWFIRTYNLREASLTLATIPEGETKK